MMSAAPAPELPPPYTLVQLGDVDSTNIEAHRRAEDGATHGLVISATSQSAGRGRRGRKWVSTVGNLYFSILLRPGTGISTSMQPGFVMANAIAESIQSILPAGATVQTKWPNDVLVNGKKISGILLEGEMASDSKNMDWVVIGVGINVANHPGAGQGNVISTALLDEGLSESIDAAMGKLLKSIISEFDRGYKQWLNAGFAPVGELWLSRAAGLGGPIEVRLPNETLSGTFNSLDENGALVLGLADGQERLISAGDIFLPTV